MTSPLSPSSQHEAGLPAAITPVQRLAASRQQLMMYMANGEQADEQSSGQHHDDSGQPGGSQDRAHRPANSAFHKIMHTVQMWWRHHPAKMALDIAEPALHQYATHKPYQLLGIAAGVGVATVFVRPWRLVSITGLLIAAIKSSGMANMALSMLSAQLNPSGTGKRANSR